MTPGLEEFVLWIAAARAGSREALGKSLEACRRYLLGIARHEMAPSLQGKGGASDIVQDTFLEAQRSFGHFHGTSQDELRAWLRQLLHHRVAKFGRRFRTTQKRNLERERMLPADHLLQQMNGARLAVLSTPSGLLMADEQAALLREAVARLPEDYQRVIALRFGEKCSFEEIGERMQRSANAARLLWLRSIERIKREMRTPYEP
jgi:RNA polymerase sigma-70 factor (ECF subfamily)